MPKMIFLILLFVIMLQNFSGYVDQQSMNDNPILPTALTVDNININPEKEEEKDASFTTPLEDSLYIQRINSIIEKRNRKYNSFTHKQFRDTVNNRLVILSYKKKELMRIFYMGNSYKSSYKATLYPHNDSLVYVEYTSSKPDIRSSPPPSSTFFYYFRKNKQIHQSGPHSLGVPYCDSIPFSLENEDFVKDFENYKRL